MTKKVTTNTGDLHISEYNKLSIQVSLNGLSFCVLDTLAKKVILTEKVDFIEAVTPSTIKRELKEHLTRKGIIEKSFSEISVIHRNPQFCLVPNALFNPNKLAHYLKFNTPIELNDHIVYDELPHLDMVNVYIPFENINNYLHDLFGEFESQHSATVMVTSLLGDTSRDKSTTCYAYIDGQQMDLTVVEKKQLLLHNQFEIGSAEDATYYILYTLEQLKLDPEKATIKTFGNIEEGDTLFKMLTTYIEKVGVFVPNNPAYLKEVEGDGIDFTVMNTL